MEGLIAIAEQLEEQLGKLTEDRKNREKRIAALPAKLDELRASLRCARGEINLGNDRAEAKRNRLEGEIGALVDDEEALTSALEILAEQIPAMEGRLASTRTERQHRHLFDRLGDCEGQAPARRNPECEFVDHFTQQ